MQLTSPIATSPRAIALLYGAISSIWILFSDRALDLVVDDPQRLTQVQTVKGLVFIAGSTLLIYVLVASGRTRLEATNRRLDRALRQTSILHRVLRHNLRNSCNVIAGNAKLLESSEGLEGETDEECLETIRRQTEDLVAISEKTRLLRDAVMDHRDPESVDLATLVERRVAAARERYPDASVDVDAPDTCEVLTDPRLELAVDELVENAVEHTGDSPRITVSLSCTADGAVLEVEDDGPGIPPVECGVLEESREEPMLHSEGLGLWITRTIVTGSGGTIDVGDAPGGGAAVRLDLQGA